MQRLLLVSNRLPVTARIERGSLVVSKSPGGLATGLRRPHEGSGGLWIGWPGDVSRMNDAHRAELETKLAEMRAVPVHLTPAEVTRYYDGFSNGVLWPLFHYLIDQIPLDTREWDTYRKVNERFCEKVVASYQPGDMIWVHDYQLMLLPGLLRRRLPDAKIGFFLHIPFPSSEVFGILADREELLQGLLGADLIGFHTFSYMRHFASALLRIGGIEPDVDTVRVQGRLVRLMAHPMGIDARAFDALGESPEVQEETGRIRAEARGRKLLVGIDRLDYTKGIPRRLLALDRLLYRDASLRGKVRMIQVAVPSRTKVEAYVDIRRQTEELVGRINGTFGTPDWTPISYMYRSLSERQVVALYRAADAMVVTPLRDGMNLVAKEFVASRGDEDGVLVLSEFAGAATELGDALIVNPYDIDKTAMALRVALTMPDEERRNRMRALRRRVIDYDVHRWVSTFLDALGKVGDGEEGRVFGITARDDITSLAEKVRAAPDLVLLLDCDGTILPFARTPWMAGPDGAIRELIAMLAARPRTHVHLVSGRTRETLETWFGDLPVGLHAEHSFWSRTADTREWTSSRDPSEDWKPRVRPILEAFAERTPGSLVEEKSTSLAWHYRMADAEFGQLQAKELRLYLSQVLSNLPVEVLLGVKVVEIRHHGVGKGILVPQVLASSPGATVVALGDDRTDEDLFAALPPDGIAIHVGPNVSRAPYRLADPLAARAFLRSLLDPPAG